MHHTVFNIEILMYAGVAPHCVQHGSPGVCGHSQGAAHSTRASMRRCGTRLCRRFRRSAAFTRSSALPPAAISAATSYGTSGAPYCSPEVGLDATHQGPQIFHLEVVWTLLSRDPIYST
jgi:hypothetical protein